MLVSDGDKVTVGTPYVKGAKVTVVVEESFRDKKILVINGKGFNWHEPDHFRVVYLPRIEILEEAVGKMADFFSYYKQ